MGGSESPSALPFTPQPTYTIQPDALMCECGCGGVPRPGRRYIHNHHWRGKKRPNQKPSPESNMKRAATLRKYPLDAICAVKACTELRTRREYCVKHYSRLVRHGDVERKFAPDSGWLKSKAKPRGECSVEGCVNLVFSLRKDLCQKHYARWSRTGTTELRNRRKDNPNYFSAHARIRRDRGRASEHLCVSCGGPAYHWSFEWRRVDPSLWMWSDTRGKRYCPYTGDPSNYVPHCVSCAREYDADFAKVAWDQMTEINQ